MEKRVLSMDNCGGRNKTVELADARSVSYTGICFFPANATDLLQSADSFVIQKKQPGVAVGKSIKLSCSEQQQRKSSQVDLDYCQILEKASS